MPTYSRRIPAILLIITVFFSFLLFSDLPTPLAARAAATITETVDLSTIREATSGEGYAWSNRYKTMTFTNLDLQTEDDYGFRFPSNATLILNGNNTIRASQVAIAGQDTLKIKGSGTLTLIADTGIKMVSPELTSSLTFMSGTVVIKGGSCGIQSDYPSVIMGDGKLSITLSDQQNGIAIDAYSVMLNQGTLTTNAPIRSQNNLTCGACDLTVHASSPALIANQITIGAGNTIHTGASADGLQTVDAYNGETSIKLDPVKSFKTSLLLGKDFPVFWDYLILALTVLLLAAAIIVPILLKRRRDRIKRAQVQARREAAALEKKEALKAARRARYSGNKQA